MALRKVGMVAGALQCAAHALEHDTDRPLTEIAPEVRKLFRGILGVAESDHTRS